jgi:hypothetical protein
VCEIEQRFLNELAGANPRPTLVRFRTQLGAAKGVLGMKGLDTPLNAPHLPRPRIRCTLALALPLALATTSGTARRHKSFCEAGRGSGSPSKSMAQDVA